MNGIYPCTSKAKPTLKQPVPDLDYAEVLETLIRQVCAVTRKGPCSWTSCSLKSYMEAPYAIADVPRDTPSIWE